MKYYQKYIITNDLLDINYRLKPIGAISYFEDCFAQYMTTKYLAAFDIVDKNLYWIVSEYKIEFTDELPFWSEEIEASSWISEFSKLKIYSEFTLSHNSKEFAKGNACWFILDINTKRPVLSNIISDKVELSNELTIGEHKKFVLPQTKEKINQIIHKTNISDIDFNNHVNNKTYINLALKNAPSDKILKSLSVKFNKETFLDDVLISSVYKTEDSNIFVHKIEKDDVSICDIQTEWKDIVKESSILDCNLRIRS